jgi:hypothetical protein
VTATEGERRRLRARIASDEAELRAAVADLKTASIDRVIPPPLQEWSPAVRLGGAFLIGLWLGARRARANGSIGHHRMEGIG